MLEQLGNLGGQRLLAVSQGIWNYFSILLPSSMKGSLVTQMVESAYNVEDLGLIPLSGRSSGEGNGNALQYSCLESPMDGGAWRTRVHGVEKSWT